jgi:hypothetical protein
MGRLAVNAQTNTGNGLAPGLWNWCSALIAFLGTLAFGQLAACALDFILNACVDLFLNRTITRPSACHVALRSLAD